MISLEYIPPPCSEEEITAYESDGRLISCSPEEALTNAMALVRHEILAILTLYVTYG